MPGPAPCPGFRHTHMLFLAFASAAFAPSSTFVHAPTARQQITLSFTANPDQFERWTPEFHKWISTLTFARLAQEPSTFADKIGTPLLVGSVIGLILVVLYRYTRAMR